MPDIVFEAYTSISSQLQGLLKIINDKLCRAIGYFSAF